MFNISWFGLKFYTQETCESIRNDLDSGKTNINKIVVLQIKQAIMQNGDQPIQVSNAASHKLIIFQMLLQVSKAVSFDGSNSKFSTTFLSLSTISRIGQGETRKESEMIA